MLSSSKPSLIFLRTGPNSSPGKIKGMVKAQSRLMASSFKTRGVSILPVAKIGLEHRQVFLDFVRADLFVIFIRHVLQVIFNFFLFISQEFFKEMIS